MVKHYDGDIEYEDSGVFDSRWNSLVYNIRTSEYTGVSYVFARSMARVIEMAMIPFDCIFWTKLHAERVCAARTSIGVHATDGTRDDDPALIAEMKRLQDEFIRNNPRLDDNWSRYKVRLGIGTLKNILRTQIQTRGSKDQGPTIYNHFLTGVESMMAALVIYAYGAFETLAEDLWIVAVDKNTGLGLNWWKNNPKKEADVYKLLQGGTDLTHVMGTRLARENKVSFHTFGQLKDAYHDAFDGQIDHVFENDDLFVAEQMRHLIAHRAGIVDARFKQKMASRFPECEIGTNFPLTGVIVGKCADACVKTAVGLVEAVDDWTVKNAK